MITFGLSLASRASPEYFVIARTFCCIAEPHKRQPGKGQTFIIEMKDVSDIQYRYRYLLACQANLQAYWRYRLLMRDDQGSIPPNLCNILPLYSREIQELESANPRIKATFDSSKQFPDDTVALTCIYAFCSVAQAEYYLKAALLYEEHALSLLRGRDLNIEWKVKFEKLDWDGGAGEFTFWLATLTPAGTHIEITKALRQDLLPRQRSPVTLKWRHRDLKHTTHTATGLFLGAEVGVNKRSSMAVLVWSKSLFTQPPAFLAKKYEACFDFSSQPKNLEFLLDSVDKLLFLDNPSHSKNPSASQIFEILMARDNHKVMYEALPTLAYNALIPRAVKSMDNGQRDAMSGLEEKMISIIDGPHGSGKTMLAATFGALSIQSGEKVTFLASTKAALKELFLKVVDIASNELLLPLSFIQRFSCNETQDWLPVDSRVLAKIISKTQLNDQYQLDFMGKFTRQTSYSPNNNGEAPTAVFGLYDELDSLDTESFETTVLLCDEAERAHDYSIFAACGLFASTLKKVALFGNSDKLPIEAASKHLNYLRNQLQLTTFSRLICTGVKPIRLNRQYHMDPDLSALPMSYMYWDRAREKSRLSVLDGVSTGDFPSRVSMQHWAARYLRKDIKNAKTSVFADVVDGICLQDSAGHAKVNHQNMVAILHILRSMIEVDLPQENIIVITFFPEAAVAMRKFLKSQKIASVRVEHVDSDKIKIKENLISIIDFPMTGSPGAGSRTRHERGYPRSPGTGEWPRMLFRVQRMVSALCVSRGLRVFVGSTSLLDSRSGYDWKKSGGYALIKDLMESHTRDEQVKRIEIGEDLLQYEEVLRPGDYVFASGTSRSAVEMYRNLELIQEQPTETRPGTEAEELVSMPWRSRTVATASAATGMGANGTNWRSAEVLSGVENNVRGDAERGWRGAQNFRNAPVTGLTSRQNIGYETRVEWIRNTNWRSDF
ncbi:hypothetical protein BGZ57DRAFT_879625 [Hyaloscypha finlandica]|nr:hypothetical protein BGZ57DRAFT_879625 [Hyaloscypha finlandica]